MKLENSSTKSYDGRMAAKETERSFLSKLGEYLLSLPFDLKILQEAASNLDLHPAARELAAGTIMHTLLPQEGEGPLRFVDDVLLVRAGFAVVRAKGGEAFAPFRERFPEVYEKLDDDLQVFEDQLGELWRWLSGKIETFGRLTFKGKRATQYIENEDNLSLLYDEGLEFETNYNVSEEQVRNRLRRVEQVVELLTKRHAEDLKKIGP
jgi:hypothetical protein